MEGNDKPHIINKTTVSIERSILYGEAVKKLVKRNEPVFLAVVGQINTIPTKKN